VVLDYIMKFMENGGVFAVAVLMFAENLFPPIPSEIVMPLAGFTAARGDMSLFLAILAGWVGSILGAVFWFWIGKALGEERLTFWAARHGRWLAMKPKEIKQACDWFQRHGGKAVLIGRMVPGVRTFISVPAGIAGMNLTKFLIYSSVGTLLWTVLLAMAGFFLETRYEMVSAWMGPVAKVVLAAVVLTYFYKVATFRKDNPKPAR
jgi:membrane protein DedA with SNARE-associated domain